MNYCLIPAHRHRKITHGVRGGIEGTALHMASVWLSGWDGYTNT